MAFQFLFTCFNIGDPLNSPARSWHVRNVPYSKRAFAKKKTIKEEARVGGFSVQITSEKKIKIMGPTPIFNGDIIDIHALLGIMDDGLKHELSKDDILDLEKKAILNRVCSQFSLYFIRQFPPYSSRISSF